MAGYNNDPNAIRCGSDNRYNQGDSYRQRGLLPQLTVKQKEQIEQDFQRYGKDFGDWAQAQAAVSAIPLAITGMTLGELLRLGLGRIGKLDTCSRWSFNIGSNKIRHTDS